MAFERWSSRREEEDWRREEARRREEEHRARRYRLGDRFELEGREVRDRELEPRGWSEASGRERESDRSFGSTPPMWRSRERDAGPESFAGVGPAGYRRSDERILEEINDRLTDHPRIDASAIVVRVENCIVSLSGSVRSREQKRLAEDVAECTSGVVDVHNELRLGTSPRESRGIPLRETTESALDERRDAAMRALPAFAEDRLEARDRERHFETFGADTSAARELRAGMNVVDSNGERVGEVKQIHDQVFHLDRPMRRDLYVPLDAVREVGERDVVLRFHADELDKMNWDVPDLIGMGGRQRH